MDIREAAGSEGWSVATGGSTTERETSKQKWVSAGIPEK